MQFLDTTPFVFAETDPTARIDLERYRVTEQNRLGQALMSLKSNETPVVIGLPQERRQFTASLWSIDAGNDRIVFRAARDESTAALVRDASRLWAAAYDGSDKVQFDLHHRTLNPQGEFWIVTSRLPSALYVLPRRSELRARRAPGLEPVIRFPHPADPQHMMNLRVHDLSVHGLSMVMGSSQKAPELGALVRAAEVELDSDHIFFADFIVQNLVPHDEGPDEWRIGCAWVHISDDARAQLELWAQQARQRKQVVSLSLDL